jgi:protein TonB
MQSVAGPQVGYVGTRRSPIGIGAAIGVHVVVAGVIMLMPKEMIDKITPTVIWARNIELPKPPPPRQPEQQPDAKTLQKPVIDQPIIPPVIGPTLPPIDFGTVNVDPGRFPGIGDGAVVIDPPRSPVLVDAAPDSRFMRDFQPAYPPAMIRAQEEGKVMLRVRIGVDGRVLSVERLTAASDAFWDATERQALRKWRFRPATRDGVPVESERVMTVHFRLSDAV